VTNLLRYGVIATLAVTTSACAQRSASIAPSYIPATRFDSMSCAQIYAETEAVAANLNTTAAAQDGKATADALLVGAGLILFWPALFMTSGTLGADDHSTQIAQMKGEAEGLRTAYQTKGCGA
jgi:hypothetical protein